MRKKLPTWILNNIVIKEPWVNEEIKNKIKKYLKANDNEDTTPPNLWDATKGVLKGKL